MNTDKLGQMICGAGGVGLIASLFLPWAGAGDTTTSGWELWTTADAFYLIVGVTAVAMALTGGHFGLFRPDLSLRGAADLLGVVATLLLVWLVVFDFPAGAGREIGAYVALASAVAIMCGAGDYGTLRGEPAFPPLTKRGR
jgi:hypothetical protein